MNGLVIMYADTITDSMRQTIYETDRRRTKQMEYNKLHGITPRQVAIKKNMLLEDASADGNGASSYGRQADGGKKRNPRSQEPSPEK